MMTPLGNDALSLAECQSGLMPVIKTKENYMSTHALQVLLLVAIAVPVLADDDGNAEKPLNQQGHHVEIPLGGVGIPFNGLRVWNQFDLLREPNVQDELAITVAQRNRIDDAMAEVRSEQLQWLAKTRRSNGATRGQLSKAFSDKRDEIAKDVVDGLKPAQSQRLREIALQMSGVTVLDDEKVASRLEITEDQRAKLAEVTKQARLLKRQLKTDVRNGNVPVGKYLEKRLGIGKEEQVKALAVLTADQRSAFDKLKGEKFAQPRRVVRMTIARPEGGQPKR